MPLKVLVPLDGSEASFGALAQAVQLLEGRPQVRFTIFNVVSPGLEGAPAEMVEEFDIDEEDEIFPTIDAANRMLDRAEELCRSHGAEAHRQVVTGRLETSILEACKSHDLLVMHQLERSQLKETMRGSKTERLARRAGIHVLLLKTD